MTTAHTRTPQPSSPAPTRFAWLSIAAAVITIAIKFAAYMVTGSVGLLSDALESVVNLVTAVLTLIILGIAMRPPDEEHAYGHSKAEYFSSAAEGIMIVGAAVSIIASAVPRLLAPQPLESAGLGLALSLAATLVNLVVAQVLLRASRTHSSIALEGESHHLMTDVYTSGGVLVGILLVTITGIERLDPIIALLVALNIIWSGVKLMRSSADGLMDAALPAEDRQAIITVLDRYVAEQQIGYHALRTRMAGARRFTSMHILVPNTWTVSQGHDIVEQIERDIRAALPGTTVFTHLEPIEDPTSFEDTNLDRSAV
ncbi:cation transporter [Chloroflexia bacterium SDU3-3]|nr:cation transporter [Chloroflexia bacterium SDU3-3]